MNLQTAKNMGMLNQYICIAIKAQIVHVEIPIHSLPMTSRLMISHPMTSHRVTFPP
jgi:hypothetical protein